MSRICALTTHDNPFDPIDEFNDWFLFDVEKGYNTCAYLARVTKFSESNSESENEQELEKAIDEIIQNDFLGIYKKIEETDDQ